ncbi:MAG TPA: protein kinase, partial [Polyangiaceae bacterium]|nr:protein kinase [Polyangiaceae bacterium]
KVVDFGISKAIGRDTGEPLTRPASVVGSLYHMAPEQMRGAPVDARTDVWALGLLLHEMLTGQKPFGNQSWPEVAARVLGDNGPLLSTPMEGVSDELVAVIHKCLSRSAQQRYGTVAELAVALSRFGSRRAHLSLERIVLLATSTGSLSALALEPTEPARDSVPGLVETRPVPPAGFSPVPPPRTSADTPRRATPATPFPVSTGPRPATVSSYWRLALGVVGALALVAPALVWVWPSAPERSEERAPLTPMAPAAANAGPPVERAGAEPIAREAPGSAAAAPTEPGAGGAGVAAAGAGAGAGAPAARPAPVHAAAREAAPAPAGAHVEAAAATKAVGPTEPVPRIVEPPSTNAGAAKDTPSAAPAEAGDAPSTPARAPAKAPAKPASPWDLHDIEFRDEAKR